MPLSSRLQDAARGAGTTASRGRWLARGAVLLAVAEVAVALREHMQRLTPEERAHLVEIVKQSKGRPSNLSNRDRKELKRILDKIEPRELARRVAGSAGGFRRK
ncbi:MAG: hypothetical protein EXQ70_04490 [Solirubrobacterales bacterium]|nr:hypothetical protein [Solirubrobacterales bacterium]